MRKWFKKKYLVELIAIPLVLLAMVLIVLIHVNAGQNQLEQQEEPFLHLKPAAVEREDITEYMKDALADHCSGYILKPLTPEKISHEIRHLRFPVRGLKA